MKLVIIKHVHSCFASVASGDVWLYRIIDNVKPRGLKKLLPPDVAEQYYDEVADITTVYVASDETFSDKALRARGMPNFANTPEFIALIDRYKNEGWLTEAPEDVKQAEKARHARNSAILAAQRKEAGFVFPSFEQTDFTGGFSEKLMSTDLLAKYVAKKGVFGYIGHFGRKFVTDAFLEKEFMSLKVPRGINKHKILATWLTSTDGRHFGDSLEDMSDDEAKVAIKKYLPEIFNLGFIYSRKEHAGTWVSTKNLRQKYAEKLMVTA